VRQFADEHGAEPGDYTIDGRPVCAVVVCPNGHQAALRHRVGEDGVVTPSVVCPISGCDWHVWARLEGWA